jgi:predicted GIY-YIG superfamily endonuclease
VSLTGEPYAFVGNDPLNAIDPLGLHRVYVLKHRNGQAYYVGRTKRNPTIRALEHSAGANPRINRARGDSMVVLETGNLSTHQARSVEEYVMGQTGTRAGTGSFPMNQRHEISLSNPEYSQSMREAVATLDGGKQPYQSEAMVQVQNLRQDSFNVAVGDPTGPNLDQALRIETWSPAAVAGEEGGGE